MPWPWQRIIWMLAYGPIPFWKDGRGLSAHRGVHSFLQPSNPLSALLSLRVRAADLGSQLPRYSMCLLSFLLPIGVLVAQHVRLFTTPWTVAHQPPLSIGFPQARILEGVAIPFSGGSSRLRDRTCLLHRQADSLLLSHRDADLRVNKNLKTSVARGCHWES